jgi:diguanylate cyclase (GGDEF)-like protein/PAS domain S-box-containing protein
MPDLEPTPPRAFPAPAPPRSARLADRRRKRWLRRPRRWPVGSSIGVRLGVLAFALGLPFVVYVGGNAAHQAALERDEAKERTLSLARLVAARIDDYIGDLVNAFALVGHGVAIDPAHSAANDAFLHRIRSDLPRAVNGVGVYMPDGRDVGTLDRDSVPDPARIAAHEYFRQAITTGKLAIEGPFAASPHGEMVVVFARPVAGADGHVAGVITVSARLAELAWLLDLRGAVPPGTVVSIVNPAGVVLTRNSDAAGWIGRSVFDVGQARAQVTRREGVDETRGQDGVERIAGYTQAARAPWQVFVALPADAALSAAHANLSRTLLFGALSLLLGAAFAMRLGMRIAQPLRELAYDALLLARGNLAHRTKVTGDDETGVLAGTLNRMAQTIEERTRALREKTAALEDKTAALELSTSELVTITASVEARERFIRLIADAIPARITYSDTTERLLFGNRRFAEYWGQDPTDLVGRRVADIVSPGAYAQIGPELARSYAGETRRFDLSVERVEGTQYYLVDHVPDVDAAGSVHGVVTISQDVTALRQAKQALVASERRMRMVADNLPALIAYLSADERYLFVNARCRQTFGLEPEQLVGRRIADLLPPAAYAQTAPHLDEVRAGRRARFQRTVMRNGRECRELVELIPDQDARGDVVGFYGLVQDVTDLHDARARVEESEQRLRRITDNIPSMVAYIDRDRRYRFNSRYYETWLERPLGEITGRLVSDVLGAEAYAAVRANLDRAFRGVRVDFDVEVRRPSGSRIVRGTYIPDVDATGQVVGVYSSSTDVTAQKEVERQLERLAQNDTLTGLPNRHSFNDGIAAALRRSQRTGTQVALLFLDVDGFKRINDTLGHGAGDDVLREFARRLSASVRATDLVARLAGDEFVIVLEGIHTREECRFVARKIIAAMRPEFRAGDQAVKVTTSIGIALGHGESTTPEVLLKRADSALYAAKGHGRDRFEMAI